MGRQHFNTNIVTLVPAGEKHHAEYVAREGADPGWHAPTRGGNDMKLPKCTGPHRPSAADAAS